MSAPITAHTLAYDLEAVITHYGDRLPPAVLNHIRGDLDRWEAQQVDTREGCRILRQWLQDRGCFVQTLIGLDAATLRQMARDYVAFLRLYGATDLNPEKMISVWEREIQRYRSAPSTRGEDGDQETTEHSSLPY